jgi:hypothetical protein
MHLDDSLPPAIRRSPAAAFEQQKRRHTTPHQYDYDNYDDSDESPDEATPPPIARSRSNSTDTQQAAQIGASIDSTSRVNPLRAHPVEAAPPIPARHKFHYPYREKPHDARPSEPSPANPRRSSRGLVSYRTNKKIPLHLRRQPSLETINSVTTTASEDYQDPPEAEAPSPDWFTQEDDPPGTPAPTSRAPSTYASSTSSQHSSTPGATPLETPLEYTSLGRHSPQALFRKMLPRKTDESPPSPSRLIIEKSTSIDRTSHRSTLTRSSMSSPSTNRSNGSLPRPPAPSERGPESGLFNVERSQSGSSSEWSASSFDISNLTEAELKKCNKKGINPALYAEMRAAKGKKWTSPIAGNTFL